MLVKASKLSPKVVNALVRTNELLNCDTGTATDMQPVSTCSQTELRDTITYLSNDANGEPSIDRLLCLGLILFNYVAWSNLPTWYAMSLWTCQSRLVRKELTEGLLTSTTRRHVAEERCLLWLATVAVGSWQVDPGQLSIEGQMLALFARQRFKNLSESHEFEDETARSTEFFENEKLCFDIASAKFGLELK